MSAPPQKHAPRSSQTIRELPAEAVERLLTAALEEDRGAGDLTTESAVPEGTRARARLIAREDGVVCGLGVFARTFELCDPGARVSLERVDGDRVRSGLEVATVEGDGRALLIAERTALNVLQRLSGIATRTAAFVELAAGRARILDTRKTTPLLRLFEKYAVHCGGGENHRFGLYDEVLLKENHIDLAGRPIEEILRDLRSKVGDDVRMTAEARDADEARAAIRGGADVVLLDNMSPAMMQGLVAPLRELADECGRVVELEASGNISLETVAGVAATGVDRISVGGLTHSVQALDFSLYLESSS